MPALQLQDQSTRHQVYIEKVKTGEANQFAAFLKEIDRSIRLRLSGEDLTVLNRARLSKLLSSVRQDMTAIFSNHWDELSGSLADLAEYEAGFEARSLNNVLPDGVETVIPTADQTWAAVRSAPLSVRGADGGKLLEPFVKDFSRNETKRITNAIRQGAFEGLTTSQIIQNVRGTRKNKFKDGLLNITHRNASAIIRTGVQHVSSVARQKTWEQNSDIIQGVQWVSTLDGRTSSQCRSLDGRTFGIDDGPRPPIHINCRSTTVAKLNDEFAYLEEGAERSARDASGKVYSADAKETYYSWLKKQPANFQNNAIGMERANLLRNGGLTAERFSEINLGRNFEPLTLAQMEKLEPTAFDRIAL